MDRRETGERRPRRGGHRPSRAAPGVAMPSPPTPPLGAPRPPRRPHPAPARAPAQPVLGAGMKLAAAVMSPRRAEEAEGPPGSPARLV